VARFAHFLKENKTGAIPHHFICFDTETKTVNPTEHEKPQELKLYTAVYHKTQAKTRKPQVKWTHGYSSDGICDFIAGHTRKKTVLYVFSSNIWFDLRVANLIPLLLEDGFIVKSFFSSGTSFQLVMNRGEARIRFLNIQNFWKVPVALIGKVVGLEKSKVDFDTVSDEDLLTYCYNDCKIIYLAMIKWFEFIKQADLGCFGITLPSQAFNAYRHRFMPVKIGIHTHTKSLDLERSGYFGGRTECFYIGKINRRMTYALDINSMYPFVMKSEVYPHMLRKYRGSCPMRLVPNLLKKYAVVASCRIDTDEPVYAAKVNGKTMFPIGRFTTTLCTGTLAYGLERGHIKRINRIAVYDKADIFSKWVEAIYQMRLDYAAKKNDTFVYLTKTLLNALYGKFGQRGDEVLEEKQMDDILFESERILDLPTGHWLMKIRLGNFYKLVRLKCKEGFNSFPAISAHVTDYARLYLWQMIKAAGRENVYYTDTDSLYCNKVGYERLKPFIDKTELGKLKLEKQASRFYIKGCKDYVFGDEVIIKGIPKSAAEVQQNTYEYDMFPGVKSELADGIDENYKIIKMQKTLTRVYDKGHIAANGKVTPFYLSEF